MKRTKILKRKKGKGVMMSNIIRKDSHGVIIDSASLQALKSTNSYVSLIKSHPLLNDKRRISIFKSLVDKPADKVNWNNKEVSEARRQFEEVMEHNDKMLEKGYHPERDSKVFKKLDPNIMLKVFRLFGFR